MDLEKFFDKVPQDRLVSLVYNMIQDGEIESPIRKYLQAGLQIKGHVHKTPSNESLLNHRVPNGTHNDVGGTGNRPYSIL